MTLIHSAGELNHLPALFTCHLGALFAHHQRQKQGLPSFFLNADCLADDDLQALTSAVEKTTFATVLTNGFNHGDCDQERGKWSELADDTLDKTILAFDQMTNFGFFNTISLMSEKNDIRLNGLIGASPGCAHWQRISKQLVSLVC